MVNTVDKGLFSSKTDHCQSESIYLDKKSSTIKKDARGISRL
jgi:hypothetical protein